MANWWRSQRLHGFGAMASGFLGLANEVVLAANTMKPCAPDTFTFPEIFGAKLKNIDAAPLVNYTGYEGTDPNLQRIDPNGVNVCNVTVSYTHPSHRDVISVSVWLPLENYQQRLVSIGGGGWVAGDQSEDLMSTLSSLGFATSTTNAGYRHTNATGPDPWLMRSPGSLSYPLVVNFAYRALQELPVISRHIIAQAYGEEPQFSYFQGCSTGGREGLTIASQFPDAYDGILSACPAVDFPGLMFAFYWPQFVMNQRGAHPPACQFDAIRQAAVESCDELDGVKDGIITRDDLCQFDPFSVVGKKIDCQGLSDKVTEDAAEIVKAFMNGTVDHAGNQLFPGYPVGTTAVGPIALANTYCDDKNNCTGGLPFNIATEWIRLMLKKDPLFDSNTLSHEEFSRLFKQSGQEWGYLFASNNTDYRHFHRKGKKLLTWHAVNDQTITINIMRHYYQSIIAFDKEHNITTQDYYRYFEAPGAMHCNVPEGVPYPLYALDSLRLWVEEGVAPEELTGVKIGANYTGQPHKPICIYPKKPFLRDGGFVCELP